MSDLLFQINREKLDEVLKVYQPHKHTKKAVQAFQKDMAAIEKYAESINEKKADTQAKLMKVIQDMEATTDIGERIYLQDEQERFVKDLKALDVFLEECEERKSQARIKHAPDVAQAIDRDRNELHAVFHEEMNKAVRIGLSDIFQCVVDVNTMLETDKQSFVNDVYDCLAGDTVVIEKYHYQSKKPATETPLDVGYLQLMPSDFLQAKNGHNVVKGNTFIIREYGKEEE
jgi:hypothetical protein